MDERLVAEPNLGLGGVDVDVDLPRIDLEEQDDRRVAGGIDQAAVGLPDGVVDRAVRDTAPVEKGVQVPGGGPGDVRGADHAPKADSAVLN